MRAQLIHMPTVNRVNDLINDLNEIQGEVFPVYTKYQDVRAKRL